MFLSPHSLEGGIDTAIFFPGREGSCHCRVWEQTLQLKAVENNMSSYHTIYRAYHAS